MGCPAVPDPGASASESTGGVTQTDGPGGENTSGGTSTLDPTPATTSAGGSDGEADGSSSSSTGEPTTPESCIVAAPLPDPGPRRGTEARSLAASPTQSGHAGPDDFEEESTQDVEPAQGGSFIVLDLPGPAVECSTFAQDCPQGEKCMPFANDGGQNWNATRCSPLAPNPAAVGEPCTVEGSGVSGIDDCALGAMCWDVDQATHEGTCRALCSGSADAPVCPANAPCSITNEGALAICLSFCNPLVPTDCAPGQGCFLTNGVPVCAPDASGDQGGLGDPCQFINGCDPGSFCAPGDVVQGCTEAFCCTPFCNLLAPVCPAGTVCVPAFDPGGAPGECVEDLGLCVAS